MSENLDVSATVRMGGRTQPPCPLHRVFARLRRPSVVAHVSGLGSTMTGPARSARSSSGAPACPSLERAAFAKSSPLLHAWVADNHQRSRLRGLGPHRRLRHEARRTPLRFFKAATAGESSGGRIWNFGGRSMHGHQRRYPVHELVFACSPLPAAAPSEQSYHPDSSRLVCRSRSGLLRAGTSPSHHDRGVGIPVFWH